MPACQNLADVRRFLGMANQLGRFSPRLASLTHPLRKLLSTGSAWVWGPPQQQAFQDCKKELSSPTVLAPYNINFDTRIPADASSFGLGAFIRQRQPSGDWRPIAYQSRAMIPTEERYSQIEKEALAVTWACERFSPGFHLLDSYRPQAISAPLVQQTSRHSTTENITFPVETDEMPLHHQSCPRQRPRYR